MADEKSALQSAREWAVDHKLRTVGTFRNPRLTPWSLPLSLSPSHAAPYPCSCFKGRFG
jgi:hypothetical protein